MKRRAATDGAARRISCRLIALSDIGMQYDPSREDAQDAVRLKLICVFLRRRGKRTMTAHD